MTDAATTRPAGPSTTVPLSTALADPTAFAALVEEYGVVAYSLAVRICRNRALAEEVVQDAFLSIWRAPDQYDAFRGSLRTWVLGIVHNRAVDALRRESRHGAQQACDLRMADRLEDPFCLATQVELRDLAERIRHALTDLPREQRQVIELAYLHELSHTEIATATGLAPGTVKSRIRLAKRRLRATSSCSLSAWSPRRVTTIAGSTERPLPMGSARAADRAGA